MEYFCTPAKAFLERRCADGHDHEFLCINCAVCMCAAVQDVHHGHRKLCSLYAAEETIKRNIQSDGSCSCCCDGYSQDRISAQIGLILCAVCLDHGSIYSVGIGSIQTNQNFINGGIDVFNCLLYALAQVSGLVAVTKLKCFKLTCGSAAGSSAASYSTVNQVNLCLNGGVSSGIKDLSADYFLDL